MNALKLRKNQKGFTLMEMLIVVAIIAVLVAILIPTVTASLNRSKEATDIANLRAAYAETQMNYLANPGAALKFKVPVMNFGKTGKDTSNKTADNKSDATSGKLFASATADNREVTVSAENAKTLENRQGVYKASETGKVYTITIGADGAFEESAYTS